MSSDPEFLLRSALRFPIPGPEHAELGPEDVRPSLQFELSDKRYQISDIGFVTVRKVYNMVDALIMI